MENSCTVLREAGGAIPSAYSPAGAWRQVADRDGKFEVVGQLLKLDFPQTHTIAVAATAIGGNHQSFGFGIAILAHRSATNA